MRIVVEKRPDDWMTYVEGDRGDWECSPSLPAAVGKLVIAHELIEIIEK